MLDGLLGRGFSAKCKLLIKATRSRIELVKRRVEAKQRFFKDDLAKLLSDGFDVNAYERMEEFVAGMNLLSFYDFVERACEHITKQLKKMQKEGDCPEECREGVSLLMFAAARFADLPELRDLRDIFQQRYGPLEVSYSHKFAERLSPQPPTTERKIQVMQNIAVEFSVKWDAKAFERKMINPPLVVPEGMQMTDTLKKKPIFPYEARLRNSGKNNSKSGTDEAEHHHVGGKDGFRYKEQSVSKEDVNRLPGIRPTLFRNKHADPFEEEYRKELKVQKTSSSSKGKMQEMEVSNSKLEPRNGEFASLRGEPPVVKKKPDSSSIRIDQDKPENIATKKPDEVKSFSNYGIPPPYVKPKDGFARPPYTKPKEEGVRIHGGSKSETSYPDFHSDVTGKDQAHPKYEKVDTEHPNQNLLAPARCSRKNESGKGLRVLFDDDHHKKDEEEILMDKLLLHYSKKPSLYDSEKLPNSRDRDCRKTRYGDRDHDAREGEVPAPSRSSSLPREPMTTGPKKVLNRASTFQADNQAKHVHPKLPDYDDLAAKFAALKGR